MRHLYVERWNRGASVVHRWDARMKVLACVLLIVAVSSTSWNRSGALAAYAALLAAGVLLSGLPLFAVMLRAAVVLPFSLAFSLVSLLAGDTARAVAIPLKSYLSCWAALVLIGTTTLPAIIRALWSFKVPRIVLFVTQFIHRYLFVLFAQASSMKRAADCRGGRHIRKGSMFEAASGTLAVLFGKSYDRAEGIHNAMVSRGFAGSFALLDIPGLRFADVAAFGGCAALIVATWILL